MKLGVLSDSHDHLDNLKRACARLKELQVDRLIHAGDFVAPFTLPVLGGVGCPVLAVFGNNDGERVGLARGFANLGELRERPHEFELGGRRLLLLHEPVALEALTAAYDLVIYGHTHKLDVRGNLLNPGEVCGWVTGRATCAVVELDEQGPPRIEVLEL
ncbi:MAG: metallophosphoesterase [Candidatus Eremiobacterota bacterium]